MCKLDLKDAYFSVPLHEKTKRFVQFRWGGQIYQFLCMCFGLGPAPKVFTKLLKCPISVLQKLKIRLIIFLDDILITASTIKELLIARDTLVFLLQNLGFIINAKKLVFQPTQTTISRHGDRFSKNDSCTSTRQEGKNCISMSGNALQRGSVYKGASSTIGSFVSVGNGSITSSIALPSYAEATNLRIVLQGQGFRFKNSVIRRGSIGDELVDPESPLKQWEVPACQSTPANDIIGCINVRLECFFSGNTNWRPMVSVRETGAYKCVRAEGSKVSNTNFYTEISQSKIYPHLNGQCCGHLLSTKDGGHPK